jgi:hypothetical protein
MTARWTFNTVTITLSTYRRQTKSNAIAWNKHTTTEPFAFNSKLFQQPQTSRLRPTPRICFHRTHIPLNVSSNTPHFLNSFITQKCLIRCMRCANYPDWYFFAVRSVNTDELLPCWIMWLQKFCAISKVIPSLPVVAIRLSWHTVLFSL